MDMKDEELRKLSSRLKLVGALAFVFVPLAYFIFVRGDVSNLSTDWGTFGDFVGGIAGTAIALVTLIALVETLRLQGKELNETRQALQDQVQATRDQLDDVRGFEARRIRPILKAEWHFVPRTENIEWVIRNVGLGPCILNEVALNVGNGLQWNHSFETVEEAHKAWCGALAEAMKSEYPGDNRVRMHSVHDLKRALAVGEKQSTVVLLCKDKIDPARALEMVSKNTQAVIHFRSLANEVLDTDCQYEIFMKGESPSGEEN